MAGRILIDVQEFLNILRGKWRKDLLKLLESGELALPTRGGGAVVLTVRRIRIPRLRFANPPLDVEFPEGNGEDQAQNPGDFGIGKGPGKPGTILGPVRKPGRGQTGAKGENGEEGEEKSAGLGRGGDNIKIEIPAEEFVELFSEILELPRIQPKGTKDIQTEKWKYTDIRPQGPESLRHKKRTLREAIKRSLASGTLLWDPATPEPPIASPIRRDFRYRIPERVIKPENNAVIFYKMDVSGSMGAEERRVVRYFCNLCSFWLSWNYDGLEEVWIIHNGEADRVTREEFFSTYRGGGTVASTAHELMLKIVEKEYPPSKWNIYDVYLSDGFNWASDNAICRNLLKEKILPIVNLYAYAEVEVFRYWWAQASGKTGQFSSPGNFGNMLKDLAASLEKPLAEKIGLAALKAIEDVPQAIKKFFGKRG